MDEQSSESVDFLGLTADVVAAFVSNNSVSATDLPALLADVHGALLQLGREAPVVVGEAPKPRVSIKRSVTPDYIVCLEDGQKFKSLKRHLRTKYQMTPDEYRAKWGLPFDYPMVSANYAAARSEMAKRSGLGQLRKKPAPAPVKVRGRTKKAA